MYTRAEHRAVARVRRRHFEVLKSKGTRIKKKNKGLLFHSK